MKLWTEAQAWAYLARRWKAAKSAQTTVAMVSVNGLCRSINCLEDAKKISYRVWERMTTQIMAIPITGYFYDGYLWPLTKRGAAQRAAFCEKMAKLAKKESR